jgi:hypothetical protein
MRSKNIENFWFGYTLLMIWDPFRIPGTGKHSKRMKLFYRAKGIVLFDRALNGENIGVQIVST